MPNHHSKSLPSNIKPLVGAIATCLVLSAVPAHAITYTVLNTGDAGAGTLRAAIASANGNAGNDIIDFAAGLNGQTITLTTGQIDISDAAGTLLIDASALASGITISGNNASRIFGGTEAQKLTLNNLIVTEGRTTGNSTPPIDCSSGSSFTRGGAICTEDDLELIDSTISNSSTAGIGAQGGGFFTYGALTLTNSTVSGNSTANIAALGGGFIAFVSTTLTNSTVSGNSTTNFSAHGGGFFSHGPTTLTNSTVSGNSTAKNNSYGGGFYCNNTTTITNSTVLNNSTAESNSYGGGFWSGNLTLTNSTVSGNSTAGYRAYGGGFTAFSATLIDSTVSGNSTIGDRARGGGFSAFNSATLTNSTVSNNSTAGTLANGGGISVGNNNGSFTVSNSTITQNIASNATGDGIHIYSSNFRAVTLNSTILSGNATDNFAFSIGGSGQVALSATNSLFGDPSGEINGTNTANVFNNTPELVALADNGCAIPAGAPVTASCVQTRALLASSPALDAGADNGLTTDQRGTGFPRVINGQADIGAFESWVPPTFEKAFSPASINLGEMSTLIFTVTNPNSVGLTGLNFTDSYPADMTNTNPLIVGGTCGSITSSAVADGNDFDLTGGTIGASTTCTVTVDVTSTSVGTQVNTATDIGSTESGAGTDDAVATLTVTTPIPAISVWGLGILAGLLGLIGFVRRRKA